MDKDQEKIASGERCDAAACGPSPGPGCSAFPSEFLGSIPQATPEEIAVRELAEDYYRVTEEYDRSVCTGPIVNGSIIPATTYEFADVNRFARLAYASRLQKAVEIGATAKQFHRAISDAAHRMQNPSHHDGAAPAPSVDGVVGNSGGKNE